MSAGRWIGALLVLGGVAAFGGLAWSELREEQGAPTLVSRVLGPAQQSFTFKAQPTGSDGAARDCVVCHSLDRAGVQRSAPGLWGIVDAPKARAGWFAYSQALRDKGGRWSEADLDRYLTDPTKFVPGTLKLIPGIAEEGKRRALIAELRTLRD